jgi:hypothetical protein
LVGALAGCGVSGLEFRQDDRLVITSPGDRAEVSLPLTITWDAAGWAGESGALPFFAVFVDREPIPPGASLSILADEACEQTDGCPDLAYFADHFVYVTDEPTVTLPVVPARRGGERTGADDRYRATVVPIDGEGRRVGESSYSVEFTVGSESTS